MRLLRFIFSREQGSAAFGRQLYDSEVKPLWLEFIACGKKEGYISPATDDEALLTYLDIIRAGISARPEITAGYPENTAFMQKLSALMFFGFLQKDIGLFAVDKSTEV